MPIEIVPPIEAPAAVPAYGVAPAAREAFRAAPLLAVLDAGDDRLIAVGQIQVLTSPSAPPRVTGVVRALWSAFVPEHARGSTVHRDLVTHLRAIDEHDRLEPLLTEWVRRSVLRGSDAEALATAIAKDLAERSRNSVTTLRAYRYGMERSLGEILHGGGTRDLEVILADIIELSTICGRAGDEAGEAVRDHLWTWISDRDAYHAHRRVLDPTLPPRPGNRRGRRRAWFTTLDAGVRQARSMDSLLEGESALLHTLLSSASTIAVTRDARAQETLSLVATVGGVIFGLPALILALYSATAVLPLSENNAEVLLPLAGAGLVASAVAAFLPGKERRGRVKRFAAGATAMIVVLVLLVIAGTLVTPR